jgi:hypothetical protein
MPLGASQSKLSSMITRWKTAKESHMSHLPSILRSVAFAAAALAFTPTSFVTGTATIATVTAVTVMTTSQAEAGRPKVRDHRNVRRCPPHAHHPRCV